MTDTSPDDIGSNQSAFREIERQRHRHPNDPYNDKDQPPPHGLPNEPGPPPDRSELSVEAWRRRELPERDYLLEGAMCTTSRWIINGETGIGKTLLGLELGFAIA